jgi:lysophospholipase L1-like esterase
MKRTRRIVFSVLLFLLPFALIALLELTLRLLGLFPQQPFILAAQKGGGEYYQFNPWVAKRYFDPQRVTVPGLQPEKFAKHKDKKTFRIFCLGESTTAGFPFDCQVPFPAQLRYLLTQAYPEYYFEVINGGISAINSFSVLDLLPELLAHEPDLIVIYMGHNEFYGAYGSASTIFIGQNDHFTRFYLKLQKLHLVQMLKRFIAWISPARTLQPKNKSLMAEVIQDQSIPYSSAKYRRTLQNFSNNLNLILAKCAEKSVPVIVGNLVSNIRDLPPFASASLGLANQQFPDLFERSVARGDSLFEQRLYAESLTAYRKAFAQDSSAARLWFKLGRVYGALRDSLTALRYCNGAKDRDFIRFRASEETNGIIQEIAQKHRAHFVDMQQAFAQRSPQGLIGNNIMVDHLHPDPNGYYLMALTFYAAIRASGLLRHPDVNFTPATTPYYVTELDWDIGLLKIFEMTHRWPFAEKAVTFKDYRPRGDSLTAAIAKEYLFVNNVWSRAHYKLAEEYLRRKDFERARREYLAVSVFAPEDPYPYQQVAKTYELEQAWSKREAFLKKTLLFTDQKGMVLYQIAMAQWQQKKLDEACQSMTNALNYPDLNHAERQNARFYLAGFYADAKNFEMAKSTLIGLLQEDPSFQPARIFLQKLQ